MQEGLILIDNEPNKGQHPSKKIAPLFCKHEKATRAHRTLRALIVTPDSFEG
jgi:hypothetical protein